MNLILDNAVGIFIFIIGFLCCYALVLAKKWREDDKFREDKIKKINENFDFVDPKGRYIKPNSLGKLRVYNPNKDETKIMKGEIDTYF